MKVGSANQIAGCLGCVGILAILVVLQIPRFMAETTSLKAGEGSSTLRAMATAHAAKPEVTAFSFTPGKGGDAGWKALGLPEDATYHSFDAWTDANGRLWMTAIGNLDSDEPLDEWEWPGPVASPVQLRSDNTSNEWQGLYFLTYDHGQLDATSNPSWSHDERMEIARRRAVFDTSLRARWTLEEIGDAETKHKMSTGSWLAFAAGDTAALATISDREARAPFRYAAIASGDALVVQASANLDDDLCVDLWVLRPPDRTAQHVFDDVDDRGCHGR